MTVHFLTEVLARRSEVEDQVEILSHSLKETVVEFVAFDCILAQNGPLIFQKGQLVELFFFLLNNDFFFFVFIFIFVFALLILILRFFLFFGLCRFFGSGANKRIC